MSPSRPTTRCAGGPGSDSIELDVVKPDGTTIYTASEADKPVVVKLKKAAVGTYQLQVYVNQHAGTDGTYDASAVFGTGPAPAATPAPGGNPEPGATPAPAARRKADLRLQPRSRPRR